MVRMTLVLLMGSLFLASGIEVVDTSCGVNSGEACAEPSLTDNDETSLLHLRAVINRHGINASTSENDQEEETDAEDRLGDNPCGTYKCNKEYCAQKAPQIDPSSFPAKADKLEKKSADNKQELLNFALGSAKGCDERYTRQGSSIPMQCFRARSGETGLTDRAWTLAQQNPGMGITKKPDQEMAICMSCSCDAMDESDLHREQQDALHAQAARVYAAARSS